MRSILLALMAALSLGTFVAEAKPSQPLPPEQCFWANDIRAFRARDSHTLDVQSYSGIVYRLDVAFCWKLQQARQIRFDSSYVCRGSDVYVFDGFGGGNDFDNRCWIQDIRRVN